MRFLTNDISLHAQFESVGAFCQALGEIMRARSELVRWGYGLHCTRSLYTAKVTPLISLQAALQALQPSQRSAVMSWITRDGPFVDDDQQHSGNELFQFADELIADSALAEAAALVASGKDASTVSFTPSRCAQTPLHVDWTDQANQTRTVAVPNYWQASVLSEWLATQGERPIGSWPDLLRRVRLRCTRLILADDALVRLEVRGFVSSAAQRVQELLLLLHRLALAFDEQGQRTAEGHRLYAEMFSREQARFSDSSDTEKREFVSELTFPHPAHPYRRMMFPFHGKAKLPPNDELRIHFSWPIVHDQPVYVVYIGPKLTKR